MPSNIVAALPHRLARAEAKIRTALNGAIRSEQDRIKFVVEAAVAIREARAMFKDHAMFGRWWKQARFPLNRHDRAALIAMGADPARLRMILQMTDRRSIRHIYENEWKTPPSPQMGQSPPPDQAMIPSLAELTEGDKATLGYDTAAAFADEIERAGRIFTDKEFRLIRECLHPDFRPTMPSPKLTLAFQTFSGQEKVLTKKRR